MHIAVVPDSVAPNRLVLVRRLTYAYLTAILQYGVRAQFFNVFFCNPPFYNMATSALFLIITF